MFHPFCASENAPSGVGNCVPMMVSLSMLPNAASKHAPLMRPCGIEMDAVRTVRGAAVTRAMRLMSDAQVWDSSLVQGPFSVVILPPLWSVSPVSAALAAGTRPAAPPDPTRTR